MRQAALVTGSSRGIGLAVAEALAREGFAIAVNGPADDAELAAAAERIRALGVPVVATPFDVTKDRHAEHLNRHGCDGGSDREMTATTIVKLIAVSPVV